MKTRHWITQSRTALLALIFHLIAIISYIVADVLYGVKGFQENENIVLYVSIAFVVTVLIASAFFISMLLKSERKIFLYILFSLPYLAFSVLRLLDIFATPMDYIIELICFIAGGTFLLISIITISRFFHTKAKFPIEVELTEKEEEE
ncbi:MAG: hypothetical protein ACTSQF_14480 [Candidatus Heimdallarchaeaceae archaeon]